MAQNSKIEWTNHTANLWWGCTKVHSGCDQCYALTLAKRVGNDIWGDDKPRRMIANVWKELTKFQKDAEKTGENNYKLKDKKTVTLPNLDDIADFINQTYLNDGKQETKPGETNPTAESNKGTSENSVQENPSVSKGAKKGKQKEIKLDKNGYVIISKKGKTPLNQRKFKGDRKEAASIEPTDAQSLVLSYFANGGKIASAFFSSKGELKAKNNGFNGIATKNAQGIDAIAHLLWESQQNKTLKLDTGEIKDAIENVVNSHNNVNDIVSTLLKNYELKEQEYPQDIIDYHQAIQEAQNEENANDEEAQEVFSSLDQLSEAEIIELAESQDKSYEDYLKDLEKRQVTYDFGPFSEQGTIQPDGWILSETGDLLSPESVSNVKQVNPDVEVKKPISKDTPELKEVNEKDYSLIDILKESENLEKGKNQNEFNEVKENFENVDIKKQNRLIETNPFNNKFQTLAINYKRILNFNNLQNPKQEEIFETLKKDYRA